MKRIINYTGKLAGLKGLLIDQNQNAIQTFERFDNYIFYMKRTLWNTFEGQEFCNPQILATYTSEDAEFSTINKKSHRSLRLTSHSQFHFIILIYLKNEIVRKLRGIF